MPKHVGILRLDWGDVLAVRFIWLSFRFHQFFLVIFLTIVPARHLHNDRETVDDLIPWLVRERAELGAQGAFPRCRGRGGTGPRIKSLFLLGLILAFAGKGDGLGTYASHVSL